MPLALAVMCLSIVGPCLRAESLTPPMTFHASFEGTLNATALGEGTPLQVDGPVEYRSGRVGQALLCGEGGAAVWYKTVRNLRAGAGTVEMWVCPLDWTGKEDEFHVFLEALDPGWLVFYRYYQGGILTLMGTDGQHYRSASSPPIDWKPGEWHHLAGTWRSTRLEVYIDGKREGFVDEPLVPEKLADKFRVGDHPWHVARKRQTLIDEVKLYSAPLDADAIARAAKGEVLAWKPQVLVTVSANPDTAQLRVTCDAAGLVGELGTGRTARVDLVPKGKQEPVASTKVAEFPGDVGRCEMPVKALPEGQYDVRATLLDAAGKEVASGATVFTMPGPPVWSGNTLGLADKVLPPWTPLQTDRKAASLKCWGRQYDFSTFLKQARSGGEDLLATPVTLEAVVAGKTIALTGAGCRVTDATDTKATLEGSAGTSAMRVSVRHDVEYDGFTWTDVTFDPARSMSIDELRLTWTMPKSQATLLYADKFQWLTSPAGAIKPEGWTSDWTHFFWLGNEERGLSWYAESDQNYVASKAAPTLQVVPEGDQVRVTVRLIAEPTRVATKLTYGFGMMATPVRPRPANARRMRMAPGVRATFEIDWPNDHMKWYGYPEPIDREKYAAHVKAGHDAGCAVVPYVNLNFCSGGAPEWQFYGSRWADPSRVVTPSDVAAMGHPSMGTCPSIRDWQDFILYRVNEAIDRYGIDGIYIDCWGPTPCTAGTCGWKDDKGVVHPTRPIRAYREMLRRVYALFRERRPNALLMMHMSSEVVIPMLSFADTILDGEQYTSGTLHDDYVDLLPPDKFRAEFLGRNYGPVEFFLPELREPYVAQGTLDLAAYTLLHDVNVWPIWSDGATWNKLYEALDAFGIADAKFLPYWQDSGAKSDPKVLVSSYVGAKGAILAVMNTGDATEAKLALDLPRLGMESVSGAVDVLRGDQMKADGATLVVPLAKHEGRVLLLSK